MFSREWRIVNGSTVTRIFNAVYSLAFAGIIVLSSCATKKDILTLHAESTAQNKQIENRLAVIDRSVATVDSLTRDQYKLINGMRAISGTQSQSQQDRMVSIEARLDNVYYLMKELNQKLQAIQLYGGVETPAPKSAPAQPDSLNTGQPGQASTSQYTPLLNSQSADPKELYNVALADLNHGDFVLAESRFVAFLVQFPQHELAGNAQYWLGEVDYSQKKYELAISEFDKVIKNYPKSEKVPAALLKTAYANIELKKKPAATAILRQIIKEYKNSEEAKLARDRLRKL